MYMYYVKALVGCHMFAHASVLGTVHLPAPGHLSEVKSSVNHTVGKNKLVRNPNFKTNFLNGTPFQKVPKT